jgi:hypothetical protein
MDLEVRIRVGVHLALILLVLLLIARDPFALHRVVLVIRDSGLRRMVS